MPIKVLICDDSRMARRQLARTLPKDWEIEIVFAENGQDALEVIEQEQPQLLFLDLNMPIMDGYETLDEINNLEIDITVIVVSGDIQPTAQQRVQNLGALDFVKKPIDQQTLIKVLGFSGYYTVADDATSTADPSQEKTPAIKKSQANDRQTLDDASYAENILQDDKAFLDACQEISNVAMGQAGDLLARFLDVFIQQPIPKVNHIELAELNMALEFTDQDQDVSSVCQGFIGPGMAGEAMIIFNDSSMKNIAKLVKYKGELNNNLELELLMDIANIIVGACLKGISEQLNISLSQGHPVVLGQHVKIPELINSNVKQWSKALAIEINYTIENEAINCDLLLLFTEDSIEPLRRRLSYIVEYND